MVLTWNLPANNGLPLTSYSILIQKSDGNYLQQLSYCDGSTSTVINARTCTVPLSALTTSPYNLILGQPVNIKVSATNLYGTSSLSATGSGAVIQLVPSAPVSLTNNATATSATQIGFYWSDGVSNGGTAVVDYTVFYDQASNNWI